MVRSPGRPAHSIGPLDRVGERLQQGAFRDLRRIKFPTAKHLLVPGIDIRGTAALGAWPTANKALFTPFEIQDSIVTLAAIWVATGGTGGSLDVGIYTDAGILLASSTPATYPTNTPNRIPLVIQLEEGRYFLAGASNAATIIVNFDSGYTSFGMLGAKSAVTHYPLPATATLATATAGIFCGALEFT